jgi:hypothetical protein
LDGNNQNVNGFKWHHVLSLSLLVRRRLSLRYPFLSGEQEGSHGMRRMMLQNWLPRDLWLVDRHENSV